MICPLEHIKQYLQITHDADDALILMLASAAEEYLLKAGVRTEDSRYSLAVSALTLHWYDNRAVVDSKLDTLPLGLRQIINQLKAERVCHTEDNPTEEEPQDGI